MSGARRLAAMAVLLAAWCPQQARAHAFDPALLVLTEREPGVFDVVWRTSPARVPAGPTVDDDPLVPVLPSRCRRVFPDAAPRSLAGEPVFWRVACEAPGLRGARLVARGDDPAQTDVIVRLTWQDGAVFTGVLRRGTPELALPGDADSAFGTSPLALARGYGMLGILHILGGVDHLLFVLGLFLLVHDTRALVRTITAFTLAHSLSLALAASGVLTLPSPPVEALIAASIVLVARELAVEDRGTPTLAARWPWLVAFAFGLVHGLGFAGALAEIGLPRTYAALALLAFNVGVEIGQLLFVGLLFLLAIPLRPVVRTAPRLRALPAYAMGTIAMAWLVQRVQAFWSLPT